MFEYLLLQQLCVHSQVLAMCESEKVLRRGGGGESYKDVLKGCCCMIMMIRHYDGG